MGRWGAVGACVGENCGSVDLLTSKLLHTSSWMMYEHTYMIVLVFNTHHAE
jgi:hypothetical protein